jgi:hypothetical protein
MKLLLRLCQQIAASVIFIPPSRTEKQLDFFVSVDGA